MLRRRRKTEEKPLIGLDDSRKLNYNRNLKAEHSENGSIS